MAGRPNILLRTLEEILGREGLRTDPASLLVYSRDASHMVLGRPLAVALPTSADQVAAVVKACAQAAVPLVCRGTGTGLSGGALPRDGWVVLSTGRLQDLSHFEAPEARLHAQPGVLNTAVSEHVARQGWHFAPDPSSQSAATIGGNIAENAGGPHCLRHGVTLPHLRGMEWCDARGRIWQSGQGTGLQRGFDLISLLCGSEGTLGVVTGSWLNLTPLPAAEATLLAFFPRLELATRAVVALLSRGLLPVAVEMVDQAMLEAVEEAFAFGFSTRAAAAMICEFAGPEDAVAQDAELAGDILTAAGADEVRQTADPTQRAELWKCRKKAFGAVGRLTPSYVTMDVVVPLGRLPDLVQRIQEIKARHGVEISTAFHAGDGNLHPGVHYDDRDEASGRRAHAAADEIIRTALEMGGSCTGEHGVGVEKLHALPWQLDPVSARLQRGIKDLFDPEGLLNPGKALPEADADLESLCVPRPRPPLEPHYAWDSLTVSAPADSSMEELQTRALQNGFWIPTGLPAGACGVGAAGTVGRLYDHLGPAPGLLPGACVRDAVLEIWARTGDGREFHAGAPVFKNVAGYDLTRALCGTAGAYATLEAATLALRPAPEIAVLHVLQLADDPVGVLPLLREGLDRLLHGTAGYNLVLDTHEGLLAVLAAGREGRGGLEQLPDLLQQACPDCRDLDRRALPFPQGHELLASPPLPTWCGESRDWSLGAPLPGSGGFCPAPAGRWLFQSARRLWWTPDLEPWPSGWHGEVVCRAGEPVLPRAPSFRAPVHYLTGLKRLFDPQGCLGEAWAPVGGGVDE